jgi:hypothetical protein
VAAPTSAPKATPAPTATPLPPTATPIGLTPDARNVELVGHLGGVTRAVFAQGGYLYVGFGPELAILDVSNPTQPVRVGYTILPHVTRWIETLSVSGSYAYVAAGDLWVVDVSDPTAPIVLGFHAAQDASSLGVTSVAAADGYAYVVEWYDQLRVIDVSDPAAPAEIRFPGVRRSVIDVAVLDGYAYFVEKEGLRVVDVSDPATPAEVGFFDPSSLAPGEGQFGYWGYSRIVVADGYAYVTGAYLWVIDVSDPVHPTAAGFYDIEAGDCSSGLRMGILVAKDHVYLTEYPGLLVIDVSDPSRPVEVAAYEDQFLSRGLAMAGDHIYVSSGFYSDCRDTTHHGGLQIVDVSAPAYPMWAGNYAVPAATGNVEVAGSYTYVDAGADGLRIIEVSDPANFADVSSCALDYYRVCDMAVVEDYAYIAGCFCGHSMDCRGYLRIVDVSDPSAPADMSSWGHTFVKSVAVQGDYAYSSVMRGSWRVNWLLVIDVSNPASPIEVGAYDAAAREITDVVVADDYVYAAADGLRVVDVSDPANPVEVGFCEGSPQALALADGYLYAASGEAGLRVLNVSDPTAPVEVGSYDTPGEAVSVAMAGDYAFVADREGGLWVVDVSEPAMPTEVGFYDTPGYARDVTVANDLVYVAQGTAGLFILRFNPTIGGD